MYNFSLTALGSFNGLKSLLESPRCFIFQSSCGTLPKACRLLALDTVYEARGSGEGALFGIPGCNKNDAVMNRVKIFKLGEPGHQVSTGDSMSTEME